MLSLLFLEHKLCWMPHSKLGKLWAFDCVFHLCIFLLLPHLATSPSPPSSLLSPSPAYMFWLWIENSVFVTLSMSICDVRTTSKQSGYLRNMMQAMRRENKKQHQQQCGSSWQWQIRQSREREKERKKHLSLLFILAIWDGLWPHRCVYRSNQFGNVDKNVGRPS